MFLQTLKTVLLNSAYTSTDYGKRHRLTVGGALQMLLLLFLLSHRNITLTLTLR